MNFSIGLIVLYLVVFIWNKFDRIGHARLLLLCLQITFQSTSNKAEGTKQARIGLPGKQMFERYMKRRLDNKIPSLACSDANVCFSCFVFVVLQVT